VSQKMLLVKGRGLRDVEARGKGGIHSSRSKKADPGNLQ